MVNPMLCRPQLLSKKLLVRPEGHPRFAGQAPRLGDQALLTMDIPSNCVIMLLTSVRTSADRLGSSSPRPCAAVSVALVDASSWRGVAWWLVPLASTPHGRVHAARRERSC